VYLLRLHDAARFTHINSTWGTKVCVRSIRERMRDMSGLRGASVFPIIRLTSAPMPSTKFPGRFRPELEVEEWRLIGGNQTMQIEHQKEAKPTMPEIGKPVAPVTMKEVLNDEIGF
jgi:hypothetical protein